MRLLLMLCTVLTCAFAHPEYIFEVFKGNSEKTAVEANFTIPFKDGQCKVEYDIEKEFGVPHKVIHGLRVRVVDAVPYPSAAMAADFSRVSVTRRAPCAGQPRASLAAALRPGPPHLA